jgi:hypothetical protein
LGFIVLYLSISLYILPSVAAILKVRKRKLTTSINNQTVTVQAFSTSINDVTATFLSVFTAKLVAVNSAMTDAVSAAQSGGLKSQTQAVSLKTETSRIFNFKLLSQAQLSALLYV